MGVELPLLGVFGEPRFVEAFSADRTIKAWLEVEVALARAQAEHGVIPASAAETIRRELAAVVIDLAQLADGTRLVGYPILPLLQQLARTSPEVSAWLHYGATTQDIMDTAVVLLLRRRLHGHGRGRRLARRRPRCPCRDAPGDAHGWADARPAGCADHVRHEGGRLARGTRPLARAARRGAGGGRGRPAVRGGGHVGGLRAAECRDAAANRRDPGPRLRRRALAQHPGPLRGARSRSWRAGRGHEPGRPGGYRPGPQRDRRSA